MAFIKLEPQDVPISVKQDDGQPDKIVKIRSWNVHCNYADLTIQDCEALLESLECSCELIKELFTEKLQKLKEGLQ